MPKPFVVRGTNPPRPLNVVGEQITVLASGDQTGAYEIFLQEGPAGSGPPPHSHPWDESFYVIKGDGQFSLGEETEIASEGTLVHLPAGTVHWFRCGSEGALMVSVTSRKGASEVFEAIDREIPAGDLDVSKIIQVISAHEVTPGPMAPIVTPSPALG